MSVYYTVFNYKVNSPFVIPNSPYGQLTHQDAVGGEEDGQLVIGTQHKTAAKYIPAGMQFGSDRTMWPFKEACIPGKHAVIVFVVLHGISVLKQANCTTLFNGTIRETHAKSSEFLGFVIGNGLFL
jgi:hypothetical protein